MASTSTSNIGLERPAKGDYSNTWGTLANRNYDIIDQAISGQSIVTLSDTGTTGSPNDVDVTPYALSDGRSPYISFVDAGDLGGPVYVRLTPDNAKKIVFVKNNLSSSRSIFLFQGTYNASNDIEIVGGATVLVRFDGAGSSATATNLFDNFYFDNVYGVSGNFSSSLSVTGSFSCESLTSNGIDDNATSTTITIADGKVGINDSSPTDELSILGSGVCWATLTSGSSQTCRIQFGDSADRDEGYIEYSNVSQSMSFRTAGNTRSIALNNSEGVNFSGDQIFIEKASGYLRMDFEGTGAGYSIGGDAVRIDTFTGRTYMSRSGSGISQTHVSFFTGDGPAGNISSNINTTSYNTTSDVRLKENVTESEDSFDIFSRLKVRQFDWKSNGDHVRFGFVAQELIEVFPESVTEPEDEDGFYSVDNSKLVPLLVKEVQMLREKLSLLELKLEQSEF